MSEVYTLKLEKETIEGIRDVISLAGIDTVTLTASTNEIAVVAYTNNIFKHFTFKREEGTTFSLRLYSSQLAQIIQVGYLMLQIETDTVGMLMYDKKEDIGNPNKIQKFLRFTKQDIVDHQLVVINNIMRVVRKDTSKVTLFSAQDILSVASFVKSDHSGVVVKDSKVFTQGEGYYVYATVDSEQMEIAFPSPVLKPLTRYLKKYHRSSIQVHETDNWVLFIFGATVFGFVAGRVDTMGGLEHIDEMKPLTECVMDFKNVYNTLKGTPVNKATKYTLRFIPNKSSMVLSEVRRGDYMIKVPTARLELNDEVMEDFELPIATAKVIIPTLAVEHSSRIHVRDYGNFISMKNQDGIVILIMKGE